MASECSSSSTSSGPKSKQERIRDNQRRSRARRQEYLAELERRLKDCHVTCREAELQLTRLADLQVENSRLRNMLKFAGINPDAVEGFGRQGMSMQPGHVLAAQHRQLRPKFQPPVPAEHPNSMVTAKNGPSPGCNGPPSSLALQYCRPAPAMSMHSPGMYGGQHAVPFMPATAAEPMNLSSTPGVSPVSPYEWMPGTDSKQQSLESSFCCDSFAVPSNGPLLGDTSDTIEGPGSNLVMDQYPTSTSDMEEIKARLAAGFTLPRSQDSGYRVNAGMVYHVLQDADTTDMYG
jgi:hypothetical protein